jgi:hypothetical protein
MRRKLGKHLSLCPASAVSCTLKWQRRPLCSKKRNVKPGDHSNVHAKFNVALALRDLTLASAPHVFQDQHVSQYNDATCDTFNRFAPVQAGFDEALNPPASDDEKCVSERGTGGYLINCGSRTIPQMWDRDLAFDTCDQKNLQFVCAQVFRRDEYASHVRNIHTEIDAGLDGWLERRCPLASYGCKVSITAKYPNFNSQIVYNPILESFGMQPYIPDILCRYNIDHPASRSSKVEGQPNEGESVLAKSTYYSLVNLPMEILEYIALYLDGFSLSNLALSCRVLRQVCYNVLPEKGVVIQQWSRQSLESKTHWYLANKVSLTIVTAVYIHIFGHNF